MRRLCAAAACAMAAAACDNTQAFRLPDPGLERMLDQPRADPYETTEAFPDGRVMRAPPRGTIPTDLEDEAEPRLTRPLLATGRARFETFCAPCHGMLGDGVSVVATDMNHRPPPSLHEERIRTRSPAHLFAVASVGYGLMPGYAGLLSPRERWAVVGYVRALWLSQGARLEELPEHVKRELEGSAR